MKQAGRASETADQRVHYFKLNADVDSHNLATIKKLESESKNVNKTQCPPDRKVLSKVFNTKLDVSLKAAGFMR